MKYVCIDGNSILNRAFYGIKLLTTKDGTYTNAIYGFLNILFKIQEEQQPDGVAIAFDLPAPTFRHRRYDGYKGTRKGMPEELAAQLPVLKEILQKMGYTLLEREDYEADDILGTFGRLCQQQGADCVLATGDRDSYQLITDHVFVRMSATNKSDIVTPDDIRQKYGVEPRQLIDVKALMGDSSDNIPGVAGIGEKTALTLIGQFGSLDGVYEHLEDKAIKPGVRAKLQKDRDIAYLSRELAEICTEVDIDPELSHYRVEVVDEDWLFHTFSKLEMQTFIAKLGLVPGAAPAAADTEAPVLPAGEVVETLQQADEPLYLVPVEDRWAAIWGRQVQLCQDVDQLGPVLADQSVPKRVFDSKALYHLCGDLAGVQFDCMLAAYLLNPTASSYDPQNLLGEYEIQPVMALPEDLPGAQLIAGFQPLCNKLAQRLEELGQRQLMDEIELPLAAVLADMEKEGFEIDTASTAAYGQVLDARISEVQQNIWQVVGREFNINSPKQLGVALFEDLGLPHGKKTKTGYSTNVDVLNSLVDKHPVVRDILDFRSYSKLKSTYVDGLLKVVADDGRIHTNFKQTETRTGRISSTEPNMQNIPVRTALGSELRKFFVAKEGYTLVDADYSQIELRVLAHMASDEKMIEAFTEGMDIHTTTASQVFGMPLDFVTPEMRRRAKAVNFGIVYGIGAYSLAQDIDVSVPEADSYIKGYLNTYHGVHDFMEKTVAEATECGYVSTLFGRRRYLPELQSKNRIIQALGKRMAMNSPIQGTAADIIKIAMCRVYDRLAREKLDAKLILQVHDELIVEAREDIANQVAALVAQEMQGAADLQVPLVVDAHVGKNWYIAKG
ncbi:DNA polymerase I [Neobittarella massiliensis]|uniref:DNA polymerase I n=1 Tax=Neobittarella massiliensis (ex Bilen et al. 2018) TaxID=2041842 RepID=UPI000CF6FF22|nr:DNA polymerase I [Neobittarella massiliensis]